jgi:hypothetical protein
MLEDGAAGTLGLRVETFGDQETIPLQMDGVSGEPPRVVFGKPVVRTADCIKAAIDGWPASSLLLAIEEVVGARVRVKVSRCWATGSQNMDAWMVRSSDTWRVDEVVSCVDLL